MLTSSSKEDVAWQAFTAEESAECEEAWQSLSEEEKQRAEQGYWNSESGRNSPGAGDDDEEDTVGVSIAKDKLFEVDVRRWSVSTRSLAVIVSHLPPMLPHSP